MFKWCCLALAAVAALALGWMVNDLRLELKRTTHSVNERLPEILQHTKKSTESLAKLADDVKQLRNLAGVGDKPVDTTLSAYYDSLLDFIQDSGGQLGKKKLIGKGLSDPLPATEWIVGARQEALLRSTVLRAKSRQEILDHLCNNWRGSDWYIAIEGQEPQKLVEWLRMNHSPTRDAPPE